ncbi:MAG: aldo/keto reductase [Candidatus Izemoplasmatales bacterium]
MDEIERILRVHAVRYPKMTVDDHLKLLYQNTFGPRHFGNDPSLTRIKAYLEEELAATPADRLPTVEDIGGGYVRVDLSCVRAGLCGSATLAEAFHRSMTELAEAAGTLRDRFLARVGVLLRLIETGVLGTPDDAARVAATLEEGIRPIHHSPVFNAAYAPHYRVVGVSHLPPEVTVMERVHVKETRFKGIERNPSLLGFGCMRLPVLEPGKPEIDEELALKMIDFAYAHGVSYFDTAYPYHHGLSEPFVGRALAKYPRESFFLATKMPGWLVHSREDAERYFQEQLSRCQVEYFDFYLCHALGEENFKPYQIPGVMAFLDEMKAAGRIRHLGFSFHDTPDVLEKIIHARQWDFVQLQLNYLDWDLQDAKRQYEIVAAAGLPVIVMEPVRGGLLATLSPEAAGVFRTADPAASLASWAIRYAASKDQVMVVLSGMSDAAQVEDNVRTMSAFRPLGAEEEAVVGNALEAFLKNRTIPCTGCRYCMPCPNGVDIPRLFRIHNEYAINRRKRAFVSAYEELAPESRADRCVWCGECLTHCPQKIMIPERMQEIASLYESLRQEGGTGMRLVNTYRETIPASRFIGKRYGDGDRDAYGSYGAMWGEWFATGRFAPLEKLTLNTQEGGAYVGLMRCVPVFQYWIGVFCPPGTPVPEGYDHVDFAAFDVSTSWIKGNRENGEIYGERTHGSSVAAAQAKGLKVKSEPWYFERYVDGRFTAEDASGDVILDYCIEIEPEKTR